MSRNTASAKIADHAAIQDDAGFVPGSIRRKIGPRPTLWSFTKNALVLGLIATLLETWPQESHAQQTVEVYNDLRLRPTIASHGLRVRKAVSAHFPALRSRELESLSINVDGLIRAQTTLQLAMAAARDLQLRHPDLLKQELANDRPAFKADIVKLGVDSTTAEQIASRVDGNATPGAISAAAKTDAALITLLESELEFANFLLSRQTAWHVQTDGTIAFEISADLTLYQDIVARITAALRPLANDGE